MHQQRPQNLKKNLKLSNPGIKAPERTKYNSAMA